MPNQKKLLINYHKKLEIKKKNYHVNMNLKSKICKNYIMKSSKIIKKKLKY